MKNKTYVLRKSFLLFFLAVFLAVGIPSEKVSASEQEKTQDELLGQLEFNEIDNFMEEHSGEKIKFSQLVSDLLHNPEEKDWQKEILQWIKSALTSEIQTNRVMLIEVVMLAFCFSILKNFAGAFQSSYIADLCFILVYCVLAVMLLKTFQTFQGIVAQALSGCVDFMKVLVPTFCLSMIFSSNVNSSMGFYQVAFFVIYLVEWLFLNILMPMIHVYVLLEVFGHFVPEEKFSNLIELFYGVISWGIKITGAVVLGLNVVQNLIGPAKDRLGQGIFAKAAFMVPGVGNAVNSVTEMLLGSGIVIKNCVGVAGLIALAVIGMIPLVKVGCLAFFYKLAAAVTEPVTDKRIAACLKGMANGGMLYLKLLAYCLLLFLLTIALTAAASSYIY